MRARKNVKRIRKSIKYSIIMIAIVLIIASMGNLIKVTTIEKTKTDTKQIYSYTNKFNYDYKVNLIPNKYIENTESKNKDAAYVTDLIDNIALKLNYTYEGQRQSELTYDYEIIGRTKAVYIKDGQEQKILEKDEVLKEKTNKVETNSKIQIAEELNLNLKEKNDLLNEFKQKMGMSIKADYTVILKVHIKTNIESQNIESWYEPTVEIDLAEKTTTITSNKDKEDTQYIAKKYQEPIKSPTVIIVDIIAVVVAVYLLIYANRAQTTNRVKNEYKYELNRILKLCQDKIVQISTKPETDDENTVYVKDFGEIIKLSEELFKPILYYFDSKEEEAWFSVMSNSIVYRYILKNNSIKR